MLTEPVLWLVDLLILAGIWTVGILIVRALIPDARFSEQACLGFGLGVASLTWLLFLLSWAGVPLTIFTILVVSLVLAGVAMLGRKVICKCSVPAPVLSSGSSERKCDIIGWTLLGVSGLFLLVISVALSYYSWDAMAIWSVKGYGIGMEGSIFAAREWGSKGIAYPLNLPIAISIFYRFDGDLLPGSKLLFPVYFITLLAGIRVYLRKFPAMPAWYAWVTIIAIGTVPVLLHSSMIGYANLPFANYYALGVMWIVIGLSAGDMRRIVAGALLLTFSIWTRLEGVEFWLIAIVGLVLVWGRKMFSGKTALGIILPALVVGGSWVLFGRLNHAVTGETDILSNALARLLHGELHPGAFYQILCFTGNLINRSRYGFVVPGAVVLSLFLAVFSARVRQDRLSMTPLVTGLLTGLGVMFMYYLTSYDPAPLHFFLRTGYDRMSFAAFILLATASAPILWRVWSKR